MASGASGSQTIWEHTGKNLLLNSPSPPPGCISRAAMLTDGSLAVSSNGGVSIYGYSGPVSGYQFFRTPKPGNFTDLITVENRALASSMDRGIQAVWVSNVGMQSERTDSTLLPASVYCLAKLGNRIFAGTDQGVFTGLVEEYKWKSIGNVAPAIRSLLAADGNLYAGTREGKVLVSRDEGSTWNEFGDGLPATAIRHLAAVNGKIFAGTSGMGLWGKAALSPSVSLANGHAAHPFDLRIVKTGKGGAVRLSYALAGPSRMTLEILTLDGRRVGNFQEAHQEAGMRVFASELPGTGIHIYRFTTFPLGWNGGYPMERSGILR